MKVPVENIFRILCYAWDTGDHGDVKSYGVEAFENLIDFLAHRLLSLTHDLRKNGYLHGYESKSDALKTLRGKINFNESLKTLSLQQCRVWCDYDEYTPNVLANQILKSTLQQLLEYRKLHEDLVRPIAKELKYFSEIESIEINVRLFEVASAPKQSPLSYQALRICEFIHLNMLPNDVSGDFEFRDFIEDERQMAQIFEKFVRNFFKVEQGKFRVKAESFFWSAVSVNSSNLKLLPSLNTDTSLIDTDRKIIIDTKYVKGALKQGRFGNSTFNPSHLNQIMSYVVNSASHDHRRQIEGVLLYPSTGNSEEYEYQVLGHKLKVIALNLNMDWASIKSELLNIAS